MSDTKLHFVRMGPHDADVVVFLHGFAGDLSGWLNLQIGLSSRMQTIAFDLPGHGGSLSYPRTCNAVVAAKAVLDDLAALGVERVHLVGHSMGGAAAAVMAMRRSEMVASLTLLAPGGFGPEINHGLLRDYAQARDLDRLYPLLSQFFGPDFVVPKAFAMHAVEHRKRDGVNEALIETAEAILDGEAQKVLRLQELGALPMPIKVLWGRKDRVIPVSQALALPSMMGVHLFEDAGHMPHLEAGREVLALIRQSIRAAG